MGIIPRFPWELFPRIRWELLPDFFWNWRPQVVLQGIAPGGVIHEVLPDALGVLLLADIHVELVPCRLVHATDVLHEVKLELQTVPHFLRVCVLHGEVVVGTLPLTSYWLI